MYRGQMGRWPLKEPSLLDEVVGDESVSWEPYLPLDSGSSGNEVSDHVRSTVLRTQ